jgi:hypothetical protein
MMLKMLLWRMIDVAFWIRTWSFYRTSTGNTGHEAEGGSTTGWEASFRGWNKHEIS